MRFSLTMKAKTVFYKTLYLLKYTLIYIKHLPHITLQRWNIISHFAAYLLCNIYMKNDVSDLAAFVRWETT